MLVGGSVAAMGTSYFLTAYGRYKESQPKTANSAATQYYKGGFEEEMTRREAGLILGIRPSASPDKIKARHRKLLLLNHPDMGGSTFVATKVNEAKDKLISGES